MFWPLIKSPKQKKQETMYNSHGSDQRHGGGGQNRFGQRSQAPRQMVQGNWQCSECQAEITELPFEPDGTRPIFCRDCHRKNNANKPRRDF